VLHGVNAKKAYRVLQASRPEVMELILGQIRRRRTAGHRISTRNTRSLILGCIKKYAPELLEVKGKDGRRFEASDGYVRMILGQEMGYAPRTATQAARKVPADANEQITRSFVRIVYTTATKGLVHADLRVNCDQTQVVVQDTSTGTFAERGSKQVAVVGKEEKRAWTAMVAASAGGKVLPLQIIMKGKTSRSLPRPSAPMTTESNARGIAFTLNEKNYWSNHTTMKEWVTDILVPFWVTVKADNGLKPDQVCILQLDCWSVHRSAEFRHWMRDTYPWIVLDFIPGGCTGIWQPMDVGLQQPFKACIKHLQNEDAVLETMEQLDMVGNVEDNTLKLDETIGTLRDRSVGWFVGAMDRIQNAALVKKAFERCVTDNGFNLSHDSVTSAGALRLLLNVQLRDPELWAQLSGHSDDKDDDLDADADADANEDPFALDGQNLEDEDTNPDPAQIIEAILHSQQIGPVVWTPTVPHAEDLDEADGIFVPPPPPPPQEPSRKRQKTSAVA
jgi:hypothetical protein